MMPFIRTISRLAAGTTVACCCLTVSSYAQQKQAGSALDPDRRPSTSTGASRSTNRGSSAPSSNGSYGMPSVNDAFKNLNNTVNEIFAERARAREARRQAQDEEDDSSSRRSTNSTAADTEYSNPLTAERAAEDERVARDRDLTERLENERRLEAANDAIAAEMNKLAKNDEIDTEMRREEFAPLVDEIVTHQSAADNPSPAEDTDLPVKVNRYEEIVDDFNSRSALDAVKDNYSAIRTTISTFSDMAKEKASSFIADLKESLPDKIREYGVDKASEAVYSDRGLSKSGGESAPTLGGALNDKVVEKFTDFVKDKAYEHLKSKLVEFLQRRDGAEPNNEYEKNATATAVEEFPVTGFLPRLLKSGGNVPLALYKYGAAFVKSGMKNLGLANDEFKRDYEK